MQFYQDCLGGELQLNTYPDVSSKPTTDLGARIIHGQLLRDGAPMLMASDSTPEGAVKPGNTFSVSIECDSIDEIERLFSVIGPRVSQVRDIGAPMCRNAAATMRRDEGQRCT